MTQTLRDEIGSCLAAFEPDGERAARTAWVFPRAFTGFQGHFPGNPVCPGVCLVLAQLVAASRLAGAQLELLELDNVKFTWPVFPDKRVDGRVRITPAGDARWRIHAELSRGERRIAKFLLVAQEAGDGAQPSHE